MRSGFRPVPTAALLSLGRRGAPQTRREQELPGRDLLLQVSPLARSVHLLQSFWGQESLGPAGRRGLLWALAVAKSLLLVLPAAFRFSWQKGGFSGPDGRRLPPLALYFWGGSPSVSLAGGAWLA